MWPPQRIPYRWVSLTITCIYMCYNASVHIDIPWHNLFLVPHLFQYLPHAARGSKDHIIFALYITFLVRNKHSQSPVTWTKRQYSSEFDAIMHQVIFYFTDDCNTYCSFAFSYFYLTSFLILHVQPCIVTIYILH